MAQEKPVPNYLKPTASSGHDTASSRYAPKSQQQQHPEDPVTAAATARKSLLSTKSMEKPAASPSSLPHKITSKEKTPIRSGFSLLNPVLSDPKTTTGVLPEKASKVPTSGRKTLTRAKSFPKSVPKIREVNGSTSIFTGAIKLEQEDKALSIDNWVQGHAARHVYRSPNGNSEGKQGETIGKSDIGKPGAPRVVKVTKKVDSGNGVPRKLKVQQGSKELEGEGKVAVGERFRSKRSGEGVEVEVQGKTERENLVLKWKEVKEKDAPPACNDAIAETATKPATRRNKVKALVGAFESVILLQETESQPSQQEDEVVAKVGRVGQPSQPKPEDQEVKVGEEDAGRGQPGRMKPKKEVEGGEECAKGGQQRNSNQRRR